jgi:hypothetical protein
MAMAAARKVSSHFEYLENSSRGVDGTWQPVREGLAAHPGARRIHKTHRRF